MVSEKRLIDANALKKRMFDYYDCVNEHTSKSTYTGETLMDYEVAGLIEDCVDDAPTVDAVEVVHGHWIYDGDEVDGNIQAHCSVCFAGDVHAIWKKGNIPYCWSCGAKMDGDGNV